jgi:amino acid transporter
MTQLVSQSAATGTWCAFTFARKRGMVRLTAAEWFAEYAFTLALKMTSAMTLIPYFFVVAYGLKLAYLGLSCRRTRPLRRLDRSSLATIYA